MIRRLLCAAGLFILVAPLAAQTWTLDRSALAGGGDLYAESADGRWQLSGTIGQPEPSERPARGQGRALRGGFWSSDAQPPTLRLFADGFESAGVNAVPMASGMSAVARTRSARRGGGASYRAGHSSHGCPRV